MTQLAELPRIQQLPPSVVNKIAAGEVVERPASVVKELVENAIDAGASRIDVSVEQGGVALVRIADNGCGIAPNELPLAVAPHATSKIRDADDLFRVGTLGFRGEALASIAEVSRMIVRSRQSEAGAGAEIEVVGGRALQVQPCGCPGGTIIEVHNLFYNTPVRRKFLRSTQTEMGHTTEVFTRLALAHPEIHFTLRHNDRPVHDLPPTDGCPERVARFFGDDLARELIWVESQDGDVRLSGYVANPSQSRSHPRMQYLFLNGRSIRDRSLQHALGEAYRGLMLTGRYPISFLQLEMPPDLVDVNVHPAKLEVRFLDSGRVYSQLLGTLRSRFLTMDLNARLQPAPLPNEPATGHADDRAAELRSDLVNWAKAQLADQIAAQPAAHIPAQTWNAPLELHELNAAHPPLELGPLDRSWLPAAEDDEDEIPETAAASLAQPSSFISLAKAARPVAAMQIHDRYVVAESEEGVVIIDQHALHERILYEQLRAKLAAGGLESQKLLVPEPVDLPPSQAAAAIEQQGVLAQLGVAVESFGGDTVLVTSYPAMLATFRPADVLHELVEHLVSVERAPDRELLLNELLHTIACKAAIKAGDRLSDAEVAALVEQRHLARDTHHCPHGRPTALVFTREQLDRQFKRT